MPNILPKKAPVETPIATDDDHYSQLANDPLIQQFPQGSSFGTANTSSFAGPAAFSVPQANGFGSTSNFSSPVPSFQPTTANNVGQQQPLLNTSGNNAAQGADVLVANDNADWINKKWRPAMGWVYMMTCTADFVVFPILWSILQAVSKGNVTTQWQPLTLQGAGLYHIAMGAVLGIAAYGRTKEKIAGSN